MRVTKTIREFIEDSVNRKITNSLKEEYNAESSAIQEEYTKRKNQLKKDYENEIKDKYGKDWCINDYDRIKNPKMSDICREMDIQINRKRIEKITDIILTLEMGGTKAELMQMLDEIK